WSAARAGRSMSTPASRSASSRSARARFPSVQQSWCLPLEGYSLITTESPQRTRRTRRSNRAGFFVGFFLCVLCFHCVLSASSFSLRLQKRLRILPLPQFPLEVAALVDQDLTVVGQHDARPLERARRRPFEIDAAQTIAAAVARTLELVFRREVIRSTAKMRADGDERVEAARVLL